MISLISIFSDGSRVDASDLGPRFFVDKRPSCAKNAASRAVCQTVVLQAFGAVQALRNDDLVLYLGEILGLVGDNSAGKSTLMKILTGAYQRDAGEVLVAGQRVHFSSPHESRAVGIRMIYQVSLYAGA